MKRFIIGVVVAIASGTIAIAATPHTINLFM